MDGVNTNISSATALNPRIGKAMSNEKIRAAAEDFEAMFISEMMRPIFEMQEIDPYFGGGQGEEFFRTMMVDEYGKNIAKSGGIGIADHIEKELLHLQEVHNGKL